MAATAGQGSRPAPSAAGPLPHTPLAGAVTAASGLDQPQRQARAPGNRAAGGGAKSGRDFAGDDGEAPLVEGDELGKQFVTQPPSVARGPVNP